MITPLIFNVQMDDIYNRALMFIRGDQLFYVNGWSKLLTSCNKDNLFTSDIIRLRKRE